MQSIKALSSSHTASPEGAGSAEQAGMGHSQDRWPQVTKGMSHSDFSVIKYDISVIKAEGRRRKGHIWNDCLATSLLCMMKLCFLGYGWTPAACEKREINSLFYFACVCMAFILPVKLPLSVPISFLPFTPFFCPFPTEGGSVPGCVGLSCLLGPIHSNSSINSSAVDALCLWPCPSALAVSSLVLLHLLPKGNQSCTQW